LPPRPGPGIWDGRQQSRQRSRAGPGRSAIRFGIFDHLDDNGLPRGRQFAERLDLIGLVEEAGFHAYHLAEHHSTPLGCAPSPSVFLSSVAQRTTRLRFGPLVYLMPLIHPLRLLEEVCMLDHLSGGRLEMGLGRGGALVEHQRYGVEPAVAQAMYHEAFEVLMQAFASPVVNFQGKFYRFEDYLVMTKPVQAPHPPVWYGCANGEGAAWAAARGINVVSLGPSSRAREITDRYRREWAAAGRDPADLPHMGITRHFVVADTDAEAKRIARDAYPRWRRSMSFLWDRSGVPFSLDAVYPASWDQLETVGHGLAGSPATVRGHIEQLAAESGVNYVVAQMVFGSIGYDDAARSLRLFGREVIPAFATAAAATAATSAKSLEFSR
jgi:alkanesulfonate monooxygenase SsuD/methylene tetrahydromethanopterin reductase-like flavin-dependent oxidoreductase (luciferase family)